MESTRDSSMDGLMILGNLAEQFGRLPTNNTSGHSLVGYDSGSGAGDVNQLFPPRNVLSIGELIDTRPSSSYFHQVLNTSSTDNESSKESNKLENTIEEKPSQTNSPPLTSAENSENSLEHTPQINNTSIEESNDMKLASPTASNHSNQDSDSEDRPYGCSAPNCKWTFKRKSDLLRHKKKHEKPKYECPYYAHSKSKNHKGGHSFTRLDVLKRHLRSIHFSPYSANETYAGYCKSCFMVFKKIKEFTDHCEKCSQSSINNVMNTPDSLIG